MRTPVTVTIHLSLDSNNQASIAALAETLDLVLYNEASALEIIKQDLKGYIGDILPNTLRRITVNFDDVNIVNNAEVANVD